MKEKTIYKCTECDYQTPKWIGKCPSCNAWSSFKEEITNSFNKTRSTKKIQARSTSPLTLRKTDYKRIQTGIVEFDRVMGSGIVPGSLTLLSGEPGIGKSTLTLQIANNIAINKKVLLVSGEESIDQIAQRASRLKLKEKNLEAINEHNLETILETIKVSNTDFAIIDSIQVISSLDVASQAGSVSQVRYCTEQIMELAKTKNIPIIIIGYKWDYINITFCSFFP